MPNHCPAKRKKISVVVPCLNEDENIPKLIPEIVGNIPSAYEYEIICVDDGSSDETFGVVRKLASKDKKIKGISFYRRFGHQPALLAGIRAAKGEAIITMDADFQHPPELLPKIISLWEKGHDLVQLQKGGEKKELSWMRPGRSWGYSIWKFVTNGLLIPGVSDFRMMDKKLVRYILESEESEVFLRGLANLAAKNPITIPYEVGERRHGKSSYTLPMIIDVFLTGFISFSTIPLRIAAVLGFILGVLSTLFLVGDFIHAAITGRRMVAGWLTIVFLMLILNGFIIFYLGILGEYIGVIFKEVKKRPKYLIGKTINL